MLLASQYIRFIMGKNRAWSRWLRRQRRILPSAALNTDVVVWSTTRTRMYVDGIFYPFISTVLHVSPIVSLIKRDYHQQYHYQRINHSRFCRLHCCWLVCLFLGRPTFLLPVGMFSYTNLRIRLSLVLNKCCVDLHL